MKWAFVGDLQIPYHDRRAVELFMKAMKWWKPEAIDFVGDIDDQLEYSQFSTGTTDEFFNQIAKQYKEDEKVVADYEKALAAHQKQVDALDPRMKFLAPPPPAAPSLPREYNPLPFVKANAQGASEFYGDVRKQHKNADMHSSLGNHDIRVFKYMNKKAPEYVDQITPNMLWGLDDLGITWELYEEPPKKRFADIYVHHGATVTDTGLAVRGDIEKYNISLVRGHDHRGGVVYKSHPISRSSLVGMGTGHLCDPKGYGLRYTINPSWEQGFGIAHVDNDKAHLQFIPIRNTDEGYVLFLDGKKFTN